LERKVSPWLTGAADYSVDDVLKCLASSRLVDLEGQEMQAKMDCRRHPPLGLPTADLQLNRQLHWELRGAVADCLAANVLPLLLVAALPILLPVHEEARPYLCLMVLFSVFDSDTGYSLKIAAKRVQV
jgi:hypothetical protein